MKPATISHLKQELKNRPHEELLEICLRLSRFKKDNKELMSYLLFEIQDEGAYIETVKIEMDELFLEINTNSIYYVKKSIRKILRLAQKHINYSGRKQTEVEILIHFCLGMKKFNSFMRESIALQNIYSRQVQNIKKALGKLHEDLQFDYSTALDELE